MIGNRIPLKDVFDAIGDEIGRKYSWYLVDLEACIEEVGPLFDGVYWGDIVIQSKRFGYYKINWRLLRIIAPRIKQVVSFVFYGVKDEKYFLRFLNEDKADEIEGEGMWSNGRCELKFEIFDGEIWDIAGTDKELVLRLKKFFSPLPVLIE